MFELIFRRRLVGARRQNKTWRRQEGGLKYQGRMYNNGLVGYGCDKKIPTN